MRRESSTVIALVGHLPAGLLTALADSGNVSVVRAPGSGPSGGDRLAPPGAARSAGAARTSGPGVASGPARSEGSSGPAAPARASWEPGARALYSAARRRATYVVVADDPLAGVAAAWRAMWDVASGPGAAASFEEEAGETLVAWQARQFELPDYYLVVAAAQDADTGPDLYLGPLRAVRPRRVAVTGTGDRAAESASTPAQTLGVLDALRSLEHGPWWPPLDELLDAARRFHAGRRAVHIQLAALAV
jgi:hypothetical protein